MRIPLGYSRTWLLECWREAELIKVKDRRLIDNSTAQHGSRKKMCRCMLLWLSSVWYGKLYVAIG